MASEKPDEDPKDKNVRGQQQKWTGVRPRLRKDEGLLYQRTESKFKNADDVIITSRKQIK